MVKRNDAVVVFDSKHKEVVLLPVGFFKDKESSILEQPEEVLKEEKSSLLMEITFLPKVEIMSLD